MPHPHSEYGPKSELALGLELQQLAKRYDSPNQAVWALLQTANRILEQDSPPEVTDDIVDILVKRIESDSVNGYWPELEKLFERYFGRT